VAWTTGGYVFSQVMRLTSNLILTRLLAPEFFGLMAIVTVVMIGLAMFSDIGLGPNIIQSPRSNEPNFLNAAWTMQVIRGCGLWVICLLSAYPLALFYKEPQLFLLVPGAGLATLISAFNSTNLYTTNRDLKMLGLTIIEMASQFLALVGMIILAIFYPSVWVLVFGSLIAAFVKLVASHHFLPGIRNRFYWDTATMKELVHFAKWIFFSTLLAFASNSTGSLILGKLVPMQEVGVFSIAATLAKAVEAVYEQISQKILLPIYTQIKSLPMDQLRPKVQKIRLGVMGLILPMLWVLILFANLLIQILFDSRYQGAGWIMRVFAIGLVPTIVSGIGPFYLALGNAKLMMMMSGIKLVAYISSMLMGWFFYQTTGLIVGMACFTVFVYFADAAIQRKYGIWLPKLDLLGFVTTALVVGGFYQLWGFR